MCSLKSIVTVYLVFTFHGRVLALNTTSSGLENSNEHQQPAGRTSVQPEEIHNLFSNETLVHTSVNSTTAVSDNGSVSTTNASILKTAAQDFTSSTTEALTSITPIVTTAGSVASVVSTRSSKVATGSISDQHSSTELVTHNVEFPLEGGGTVANINPSTPEHTGSKVNTTGVQSNESPPLENMYSDTEQSNKTSVGKGAEYKPSKVVARKGVGSCTCCPNVTNSENCTICCGPQYEFNSGEEIDEKSNTSTQGIENVHVTSMKNNTVVEQRTNTSTVTSPAEAKKTKATKPLYTVDAVIDNFDNISAIQTPAKKLEQGSNYVVPVVGTILMVPLVAVLSVFMYKKGCEFWERRHYRRMDFLIDGMYND